MSAEKPAVALLWERISFTETFGRLCAMCGHGRTQFSPLTSG